MKFLGNIGRNRVAFGWVDTVSIVVDVVILANGSACTILCHKTEVGNLFETIAIVPLMLKAAIEALSILVVYNKYIIEITCKRVNVCEAKEVSGLET